MARAKAKEGGGEIISIEKMPALDRERMTEIDRVAKSVDYYQAAGTMEKSIELALAIKQMRELVTEDFYVQYIEPLQDTRLGFATDRPIGSKARADQGAYTFEALQQAIIEALIRGFRWVGYEFCVISRNFYGMVNGYERLVTEFPGLSGFDEDYGAPRYRTGESGRGMAIVPSRASWLLSEPGSGKTPEKQERKTEVVVLVNRGMGPDAILGKARRKLYAQILRQLTRSTIPLPEGSPEDLRPDYAVGEPTWRGKDPAAAEKPKPGRDERVDPGTKDGDSSQLDIKEFAGDQSRVLSDTEVDDLQFTLSHYGLDEGEAGDLVSEVADEMGQALASIYDTTAAVANEAMRRAASFAAGRGDS